jgi:predicted SnoaL-like aldol condensation-catalyzing enzyme
MNQTVESKNKALVVEAFDTLFNKRDYGAAETFWSRHYIQHSAHIAPGREGPVRSHQKPSTDSQI